MLLSMRGREETALAVEAGVDTLRSPRSYDLVLIVTLADRAALERYQTAGYHAHTVKPYMHAVTDTAMSVSVDLRRRRGNSPDFREIAQITALPTSFDSVFFF